MAYVFIVLLSYGHFSHEFYQNRGIDDGTDHSGDDDNDDTGQETPSPPPKKLRRTGRSVHS